MTPDCLIIGAGPAGLVAATYLGRFRRRVTVLGAGKSRAAWIPVSHNTPGFPEGISGPALLGRMRDQAGRYGARFVEAAVESLAREPGGMFAASTEAGVFRAPRVLLATGGEDVEPELPGLEQAVARGLVRQCPICDAFEVTDKRVALIGYGKCRVREALLLRSYTADLTVLTLGRDLDLPPEEEASLREAGIRVLREPVARLGMQDGRIAEWHMASGARHRFDTLYTALGWTPRSRLACALGAAADEDGALIVDAHQRTSVDGLYAAGDVVRGLSQISVAAGQAAIAATDINRSMPFPWRSAPDVAGIPAEVQSSE